MSQSMLTLFVNLAWRFVKNAQLYNTSLFIGKLFVKKMKFMNKLSIFIKSISQFIQYKPIPAYAQLIIKENIPLPAKKTKTLKIRKNRENLTLYVSFLHIFF